MPLEEWHLSDSCYAMINTPDTDTSRKTRSWIGAFGLMIADSPSEQMVQIPKAHGSAMHVHRKLAVFCVKTGVKCGSSMGWDRTPCVEPCAHWGTGSLEPFLLPPFS